MVAQSVEMDGGLPETNRLPGTFDTLPYAQKKPMWRAQGIRQFC